MAHGCSAYSRPSGASASSARRAAASVQPPFASTRIRPASPRTDRTAATRATSSSSDWPCSATLTFAVEQPGKRRSTVATASAATAGTVALTGTEVRSGAGQPVQAASTAPASQRAASSSSYSRNGENSPQPAGPRSSRASRSVTPRNGTRSGTEITCAPSSSCVAVGTGAP